MFSELLRYTSVRELSLCNARLHLAVHEGPLARLGRRDDAGAELLRAAPPPACPAIVFLRLAGFQVSEIIVFSNTAPKMIIGIFKITIVIKISLGSMKIEK